jgi:hypothetical protein
MEQPKLSRPIPLWDGHAGTRAATVLLDLLRNGAEGERTWPELRDAESAS